MSKLKKLRLILGDQLNHKHSWFLEKDSSSTLYLMMEIRTETDYAKHHILKIVTFFKAMRCFYEELKQKNFKILYLKINDKSNLQDFSKNIDWIIKEHEIEKLEIQEPDEYRLDQYFKNYFSKLKIPYEVFSSEHFLVSRDYLEKIFGKKDKYLMESFYRRLRKELKILMNGSEPLMGKWNFDKENRKPIPKNHKKIKHLFFKNDVLDILNTIKTLKINYIGHIPKEALTPFPVNREQSLKLLEYFSKNLLKSFGEFEDAMSKDDEYIYHSRLSFALNTKMLHPQEVIDSAIQSYENSDGEISFAQLEGFVRQIMGWREFIRSFYWTKMPELSKENFFNFKKDLPEFYWTGKTEMNCLKISINNSLDNAYAHHIQRLMITGNYALLSGVDPDKVEEWYLGIYADALEWVEKPNTRSMSQWADGGDLATKPYISSANYINKMSDYCKNCSYDHKKRIGKDACPFNYLYWNFLNTHKQKLSKNPRMSMIYKLLDKIPEKELNEIKNLVSSHF